MKKINLKTLSTKEIIGSLLLITAFVLPFLTFAHDAKKQVYVNANAVNYGNGTSAEPFKTISAALKDADKNTEVHIAAGEYKDNIEIPKGVEVYGEGENKVKIIAKNDDKAVVMMSNDSTINKVTIQEGRYGIYVKKDAKASIVKVTVKNNDREGIKIDKADVKDSKKVSITESKITKNGRGGIYSQKRRIVLMDNEISENESDGVNLEAGSKAWIENNNIKNNDGSGMKLTLDESNIWTKKNDYRNNKHEGVEINAWGKTGRIDFNKSKFAYNDHFGIAKIQRAQFSSNVWKGLSVQSNNSFLNNGKGGLSPLIRIQ